MRALLLALLMSLAGPGLATAGPVEDCDRLAADPRVSLADITAEARDACAAALDVDDSLPRLMHQYARALEAGGETAAALRYYGWAAEDGYPAAAAAVSRLGAGPRASEVWASDPMRAYAEAAGDTPEALARTIARDFILLPHGRAVRAPEAVLVARRGSEPDLARLLAALIVARDPAAETRFGICRLTSDAPPLPLRPGPPPVRPSAVIAAARATPGVEPAALAIIDRFATVWTDAVAEGRAEAMALADDIRVLVPQFRGVTTPPPAPEIFVTVEAHSGTSWQLLDPVRGGIFDPAACADYTTNHDLPADLTPQLRVTLTATDEGAEPRVLLDATVPIGSDASFAFAESWGLTPPDTTPERGIQTRTPVLSAGERTVYGTPVRLNRPPSALPDLADTLGASLGDVSEALGGEATPETPPVPDTLRRLVLTAQLDGGEVATFTLMDRDGASPMAEANGAWLDFLQVAGFVPLDGSMTAPREDSGSDLPLTAGALSAELQRTGAAMSGFDGWRRAIFAELSDTPAPEPRSVGLLTSLWSAALPEAEGGETGTRVRNHMLRGDEPAGTVEDAAAWAVASVLAERLVLQLGNPDFAPPTGPDAVAWWTSARPGTTIEGPLDLIPPDERARGEAEIAAGRVLLRPIALPRVWWSVDPARGTVTDLFPDGGRQALTEEAELDREACQNVGYFARIGMAVRRLVAPVALVLMVHGGNGEMAKAVIKMAKATAQAEAEDKKKRRAVELASKACAGKSAGPGGGGGG